jgi:peptidoglycan/LPS O-acetylase OafA/YrhL
LPLLLMFLLLPSWSLLNLAQTYVVVPLTFVVDIFWVVVVVSVVVVIVDVVLQQRITLIHAYYNDDIVYESNKKRKYGILKYRGLI